MKIAGRSSLRMLKLQYRSSVAETVKTVLTGNVTEKLEKSGHTRVVTQEQLC